jgi:hypothetical protein
MDKYNSRVARCYYFVNLVSLPFHVKSYQIGQRYYVDSMSLSFVLKFLGVPHKRVSGIRTYQKIEKQVRSYYLLPFIFDPEIEGEVLPYLENADIDSYASRLTNRLDFSQFDRLIIGISSPKQDRLARGISKFYNGEIYCLGAAIQYRDNRLVDVSDVVGLTWVLMLIRSPLRTVKKIVKTMVELILIIASRNYRDEIKKMNFQN